jgi:hypothetical protein
MLAVVESIVCAKCAQERLLERIVGALGAELPSQEAQYLRAVLLVEALERGDRHGFHHPRQTPASVDL